ncbi:MAG: Cupin 4 [Massilia sp.]|nr:Cupin 4 [Massilia sp.]
MSVSKLIFPLAVDEFIAQYHERNFLHVRRDDFEYFRNLYEDLELERNIWCNSMAWGEISLARPTASGSDDQYAALAPCGATIQAALADGYTVVMNNYQNKSEVIGSFCRDVERFFFARCNVNLYMTPPDCQGLSPHYDDQDVYVMQLDGSKKWRLYEGGPGLPTEVQQYFCPETADLSFVEVVLLPGDVLYLPRGFIHEAKAQSVQSTHLTLSVSAVRLVTFLKELLDRTAETDVELRKAISHEHLSGVLAPAGREIQVLKNWASSVADVDVRQTFSHFQDIFLGQTMRLPAAEKISATVSPTHDDTLLGMAQDQICLIAEMGEYRVLKFIGGQVDLADDLLMAARFVCDRRSFQVRDLPGELTSAEKIAFAVFLRRLGLLVAV